MAAKKLTYEQAREKLDAIVERLSGGQLPLNDMVKLYEEGTQLSSYCLEMLEEYEGRLETADKALSGKDDEQLL